MFWTLYGSNGAVMLGSKRNDCSPNDELNLSTEP